MPSNVPPYPARPKFPIAQLNASCGEVVSNSIFSILGKYSHGGPETAKKPSQDYYQYNGINSRQGGKAKYLTVLEPGRVTATSRRPPVKQNLFLFEETNI